MTILGAILAGGDSSRFGSDKALAIVDDKPLMQHAIDGLAHQVDAIISCGYAWPDIEMISDRPAQGLGPLGGISAALAIAQKRRFDSVLSISVDSYPIPGDLATRLSESAPCYVENHYTIGNWPVFLSADLDSHLAQGHRSMMSWIEKCNATPIFGDWTLLNINAPHDLPRS